MYIIIVCFLRWVACGAAYGVKCESLLHSAVSVLVYNVGLYTKLCTGRGRIASESHAWSRHFFVKRSVLQPCLFCSSVSRNMGAISSLLYVGIGHLIIKYGAIIAVAVVTL